MLFNHAALFALADLRLNYVHKTMCLIRLSSHMCALPYHSTGVSTATAWQDVGFNVQRRLRRFSNTTDSPRLYPTHVPLHPLQKGAITLGAAVGALLNPARADLVATLGETTGWTALVNIRDRMRTTAEGRQLLFDRPRVTNAAVAFAWDLEPHTFGAHYAKFMGDRNFQADDRPPVRFVDDEELAYVAARAREVHDFWHVLFECHTNVLGELALKAVEYVQTGLPMTALAVAGAQYRLKQQQRAVLRRELLPWAWRAGSTCTDLMSIYYEKHFHEDIDEVRQRWRIIPAPQVFKRRATQQTATHVTSPADG